MPRTPPANKNDVFLGMLREARRQQGVTQEVLAQRLGFRQTDVSKVERGVRRLDALELRDWVVALGIAFPLFAHELDSKLSNLELLQRQAVSAHPGQRSVKRQP